jgi:hypothetical protein
LDDPEAGVRAKTGAARALIATGRALLDNLRLAASIQWRGDFDDSYVGALRIQAELQANRAEVHARGAALEAEREAECNGQGYDDDDFDNLRDGD